MAVTGRLFNSLVFGGVNSADYGVYITGEAVYNAPTRAVEMVSVPGRNGDVPVDMGHWDNIEVTYPCGVFGDTQAEMSARLSDFRNAVVSQLGYQRLSDTYHPNEYRLGVYMSGIEFAPTAQGKAGEFDLKFNCKPQRFLTDGEEMIDVMTDWGDLKTGEGEIVTFTVDDTSGADYTQFKSLTATIDPIQEGSGTPSPDNVRPISGWDEVSAYISPTTDKEDGTTHTATFEETVYGGTVDLVSGVLTDKRQTIQFDDASGLTFQQNATTGNWWASAIKFAQTSDKITDVLCDCLTPSNDAYNGNKAYTCRVLASGRVYISLSSEQTSNADCQAWLAEYKPTISVVRSQPQTAQLDPQTIATLVGVNNVWAESGDVSVEYGTVPGVLVNPTQYDSSPLIEVEGSGEIALGDYVIYLADVVLGDVDLWSSESFNDKYVDLEISKAIPAGLLNTGDAITMKAMNWTAKSVSSLQTIGAVTISGTITGMSGATISTQLEKTTSGSNVSYRGTWAVNVPEIEFIYGTPAEISLSITVTWGVTSLRNTEKQTVTIGYDGVHTITANWANTRYSSDSPTEVKARFSMEGAFPAGTGASTVEVTIGTVIIDSETGDAYTADGETYISLNKYIQLGAQLPTLKPGANLITYDSTIESLKIAPRWWKL